MSSDFDMNLKWDSKLDPPNAQQTLGRMLNESDRRLTSTMQDAANQVEREAKRYAPVGETGNLRASIDNEVTPKRGEIIAEIGTNTEYAPYVEYGTSRMAAQPFMRPAFDSVTSDLERKIRMAIVKAAGSAGGLR